jgi:hypothetical protein
MTTVIFIHGTGVRDDEFAVTYGRITAGFGAQQLGVEVERCYWGGIGAKLNADGKSFYFDRYKDREAKKPVKGDAVEPVPEEEKQLAQWACLIDDPLFEVRLEKMARQGGSAVGAFGGRTLGQRVSELHKNEKLAAELNACGLTEAFDEAVESLTQSAEFRPFFADSTDTDGDTLRLLSRALVRGAFNVPPDYGVIEGTVAAWDNLKYRSIDRLWLRKQRRATIDQMADVVFYQAHGDGIRRYLRDCLRKAPGDVVLLGHSLGGVIAFDLLAGEHRDGLDQVRMLVTVGSQVPLLYELRALTCGVNYGTPLPDGFPRWINVYDKNDLLAYAGDQLFEGRCQDIALDTKTPFPTAHGAYWDHKSGLYGKLAAEMRAEGLCP